MTLKKPTKSITKRKTKSVKTLNKSRQFSLFETIVSADENKKDRIVETIKSMLEVKKSITEEWRGLVATPPGSFLENVISCFYNRTDIPLEIPFFTSLHYLSYYLLKTGVHIEFDNQIIKPDLWTVLLAQSGAGKTFASKAIGNFIDLKPNFPDVSSSAKFVEELSKHNNGFFLRDEFAQLLKSIETQPHFQEMKDYFLRLYDGEEISRITMKNETIIENPALVILGITVLETFLDNVSPESLADGFSQRFNYVIARKDAKRSMRDFPLYEVSDFKDDIKKSWEDCISNIKHEKYFMKEEAKKGFITSFKLLCDANLPDSFLRRIMFRGIRYALLYHILLGDSSNEISVVDMGWAGRICALHIKDASELLDGHDKSELQNLITQAEKVIERLKEKGEEISPRNLVRNMSKIKTTVEAKALLSIINC